MKPVLFFILTMLAVVPVASAKSTASAAKVAPSGFIDGITTYRGFIFGVSMDIVREHETAAFYKEEEDSLYFLYKPDFFRRMIRYDFENDRLVRIHHEVIEFHFPVAGRVVDTYYDVKQTLSSQYGPDAGTDLFWKRETYRNHPDFWGRSLYSGDLRMVTNWSLPDATITLDCYRNADYYQLHYTIEVPRAAEEAPNRIDLSAAPLPTRPLQP